MIADGLIKQNVKCVYQNSQQECKLPVNFSNTFYAYIPYLVDTIYSDNGRNFGYNLKSISTNRIEIQVNFVNSSGDTKNSNIATNIFSYGY